MRNAILNAILASASFLQAQPLVIRAAGDMVSAGTPARQATGHDRSEALRSGDCFASLAMTGEAKTKGGNRYRT